MKAGAIILCGGESTRMGRDKATLPFGPQETLLQRVVQLVGEVVPPDQTVCVGAPDQVLPHLPDGVRVVRDPVPHCGPLAGLAAGLEAVQGRADAVFAMGCDAPLLVPALVRRMFELLGDHEIAALHDGQRWHPLAAVYRTEILAKVQSLLAAGERSIVALIETSQTRRVAVEDVRDVDPGLASLTACNTPADYQQALNHGLRGGHGSLIHDP